MIAVIGVTALWLFLGWLAVTIVCQYLAERKGYGTRWGLATGLIFPPGVLAWLVIPARPDSDWKVLGPFGGSSLEAVGFKEDEVRDKPSATEPSG